VTPGEKLRRALMVHVDRARVGPPEALRSRAADNLETQDAARSVLAGGVQGISPRWPCLSPKPHDFSTRATADTVDSDLSLRWKTLARQTLSAAAQTVRTSHFAIWISYSRFALFG
jgi:hypothetical protein